MKETSENNIISIFNFNILKSLKKLLKLFDSQDKKQITLVIFFAFIVSITEILTAFDAMIFAQVLIDFTIGINYLKMIGVDKIFSTQEIIFISAFVFGCTFILKSLFTLLDYYIQISSVNDISFRFKQKMMHHLSDRDYKSLTSNNSTFNKNLISGECERLFNLGLTSLGQVFLEGLVFLSLTLYIFFISPYYMLTPDHIH